MSRIGCTWEPGVYHIRLSGEMQGIAEFHPEGVRPGMKSSRNKLAPRRREELQACAGSFEMQRQAALTKSLTTQEYRRLTGETTWRCVSL